MRATWNETNKKHIPFYSLAYLITKD